MSEKLEHHPPRGSETADTLAAVLAEQKEREARRTQPPPPKNDRGPALVVLFFLLAAATAWMLVAPPSFVRPPALPEPTPAEVEAGLRMDVFGAAASVRRWSGENGGRLPADLSDAWPRAIDGSMVLEPLEGGSFRIVARRGEIEVVYHSSEPMAELLGRARSLLDGRTP